MKTSLFILGMIIFSFMTMPLLGYSPGAYAQEKKRICATMEVHDKLLKTVPAYRDSRAAIENLTRDYLLRGGIENRDSENSGGCPCRV